jgi:hypothetical protein
MEWYRSTSANAYPRSQNSLLTSSSYQKAPHDKSVSSKNGDKDRGGLNNRTSGFSTNSKTQGSSNAELSTKESPKDHPMEMITHDQKHDLLGLALHNSTSPNLHYEDWPAPNKAFQFPYSEKGDRCHHPLKHSALEIPTATQTQLPSSTEFSTERHTAYYPQENPLQGQIHDLLDPASPNATGTKLHHNSLQASSQGVHSLSLEHVTSICPVHSIAITDDHGDENFDAGLTSSQQEAVSNHAAAHMPIERYLAEGVGERYAILSFEEKETESRGGGEGYSRACLCGGGARL